MLISAVTASGRRSALALVGFLTFGLLLYRQREAVVARVPWSSNRVGEAPPLKDLDRWILKGVWNPLESIYDNFTDIDDQYAASVLKLQVGYSVPTEHASSLPSSSRSRHRHVVPCIGPRGTRPDESSVDEIVAHRGRPMDFAEASLGSSAAVGLEQDVCYDRYGRYSAYGLTQSDGPNASFDWDGLDWADLQKRCVSDNSMRFDLSPRPDIVDDSYVSQKAVKNSTAVARTAVVFRSHDAQIFTPDVVRYMRSIIEEVVLQSGGEYQAFLLVEIKDINLPIWEDPVVYQEMIDKVVPLEFRNMTVLWNEWRWRDDYPMLPEDTLLVHKSQWLSMQFFQKLHPEFDFFWNWEMDIRYTGRYDELVKAVTEWSDDQPRKGLWERSSRFYIPKLHGDYQRYRRLVQSRYAEKREDTSIWGPQFPGGEPSAAQAGWLSKLDTTPPVSSPLHDGFEWGVGESADFITFLPMFDPDTTKYVYQDAYFNYPDGIESANMPRRTTIITFSRVSARLLRLMELENTTPPGHHLSSESWPQTVALHYGLKAVTVPHSVYMEKSWPAQAVDWIFNNGDKLPSLPGFEDLDTRGEGAGGPESTFGLEREHNWAGSTWYYQNRLAERLYKRWLGWEVDGKGGKQWEKVNGRYCLPPMLLHPVKLINDPVDGY